MYIYLCSIEPNGVFGVEHSHSLTGDRGEHLLPDPLIAAPPVLNQLFFDLEQRFALEFSLVQFLPEEDQQFGIFGLVSDDEGVGVVDDHAGLR